MITQIMIGLTGAIAILLSQNSKYNVRKYACLFGLVSQPFWFIATYQAEQWGMFALCFIYAFAWLQGFYNYWIKKEVKKEI